MNSMLVNSPLRYVIILIIFSVRVLASQADTITVREINNLPSIDGNPNDSCWSLAEWQTIDQVWMNYGEKMNEDDFSGAFKLLWSAKTNLLYILVEIQDDVFVDDWPNHGGDYYDYDIVEVFIDQDKSGGLHVFDGTGDLGTNAENAFSYHINMNLGASGKASHNCYVNDIAGTNMKTRWQPNYSSHFPEIALKYNKGKYYWEFSLKCYDDSYEHSNPEASRVKLRLGDIIGFAMAYCDNDGLNENPKTRDNFIGSVVLSREQANDCWKNADVYGTIMLVE